MATVRTKYMLDKLTQPVDRSVWLMPGNLNNACYDPQRNDLTFPAGILQAPFMIFINPVVQITVVSVQLLVMKFLMPLIIVVLNLMNTEI